jgi:hypothetical protein
MDQAQKECDSIAADIAANRRESPEISALPADCVFRIAKSAADINRD